MFDDKQCMSKSRWAKSCVCVCVSFPSPCVCVSIRLALILYQAYLSSLSSVYTSSFIPSFWLGPLLLASPLSIKLPPPPFTHFCHLSPLSLGVFPLSLPTGSGWHVPVWSMGSGLISGEGCVMVRMFWVDVNWTRTRLSTVTHSGQSPMGQSQCHT